MKMASFRFIVALLMLSLTLGPAVGLVRAENKLNLTQKTGARVVQSGQGSSSSSSSSSNAARGTFTTAPKLTTPIVVPSGNVGAVKNVKIVPNNTLPNYGTTPIVVKPTLP